MAKQRYLAVGATVANSFGDAVLDYSVNHFNYYRVLFLSATVAGIIQFLLGFWGWGIEITWNSMPHIVIHAILVLGGYLCFIKALELIPIGLIGLIESSSLFLTCIIDVCVGYVDLTAKFVGLLILFVLSLYIFTLSNQSKEEIDVKKITIKGFGWAFSSVLLYLLAPYLIKSANTNGANEIAINLGYYAMAIPFYAVMFIKTKSENPVAITPRRWWQNFYLLGCVIGGFEGIYYVLETLCFIEDAPTIISVIAQMRIFLVYGLSVLFKMDDFSFGKVIALCLGLVSVVGIYLT